jgi:hypothetical protein
MIYYVGGGGVESTPPMPFRVKQSHAESGRATQVMWSDTESCSPVKS